MIPWIEIAGVGVILFTFYTIYKGEIAVKQQDSPRRSTIVTIKRAEKPGLFWGLVMLLIVIGLVVIWLGVFL